MQYTIKDGHGKAECDRLAERLDPGATVPAGECACGAFLYLLETGE